MPGEAQPSAVPQICTSQSGKGHIYAEIQPARLLPSVCYVPPTTHGKPILQEVDNLPCPHNRTYAAPTPSCTVTKSPIVMIMAEHAQLFREADLNNFDIEDVEEHFPFEPDQNSDVAPSQATFDMPPEPLWDDEWLDELQNTSAFDWVRIMFNPSDDRTDTEINADHSYSRSVGCRYFGLAGSNRHARCIAWCGPER